MSNPCTHRSGRAAFRPLPDMHNANISGLVFNSRMAGQAARPE